MQRPTGQRQASGLPRILSRWCSPAGPSGRGRMHSWQKRYSLCPGCRHQQGSERDLQQSVWWGGTGRRLGWKGQQAPDPGAETTSLHWRRFLGNDRKLSGVVRRQKAAVPTEQRGGRSPFRRQIEAVGVHLGLLSSCGPRSAFFR